MATKKGIRRASVQRYPTSQALFEAVTSWASRRFPNHDKAFLKATAKPIDWGFQAREELIATESLLDALDIFARKTSLKGMAIEAIALRDSLAGHATWLSKTSKKGRFGWRERFLHDLAGPLLPRLDGGVAMELAEDDVVALSILAGMVNPADYDSIVAQAHRKGLVGPTLIDGLEVERKRFRKVLNPIRKAAKNLKRAHSKKRTKSDQKRHRKV